eukprot:6005327-Alexandrium_andersonii.AAC.1
MPHSHSFQACRIRNPPRQRSVSRDRQEHVDVRIASVNIQAIADDTTRSGSATVGRPGKVAALAK